MSGPAARNPLTLDVAGIPPAVEAEIRTLAKEGREHAGRLGKGRWEEIIRIAELRAARGQG